jgi:O-methyltransferase
MQQEMTPTSGPFAGTTVKCPTRVITYAWGEKYTDTLLTLTLPALLAPGNLPYVASEVPCELAILTERRFFSKFNRHPAIARVRSICPVRFIQLDDLIVSKDKYGMTLTYALHRGFSDLGPAVTECWQIFLNADFILADGSLRAVIGHLSRGQRIVASPSYCTIAEEVTPELHKHLDAATSTLSISHRELARLVLQHRHTVIRGKTVNQTRFHMRYADQFYWSVDDTTLIGYQMPVAIVGLRPQRYLREPNSYWDFGLIWEYCPQADICVIGDSDEFAMLELRDKSVAEDQVVPGPANKQEIAELMVTWVTPYQRHFLKFPLTLHDRDLPPTVEDARVKLRSFVDEVMSNAPPLPSHIKHSQWEYHWAGFHGARRLSSRIRSGAKARLQHAATAATSITHLIRRAFQKTFGVLRDAFQTTFGAALRAKGRTIALRVKRKAIEMCKPFARVVGDTYVRPALRRLGLEIVRSITLSAIQKTADEATLRAREATLRAEKKAEDATEEATLRAQEATLRAEEVTLRARQATLNAEKATPWAREATLTAEEAALKAEEASLEAAKEATRLKRQLRADRILIVQLKEKITDLSNVATEYQLKLERSYDYQALTVQNQLRAGMSNLEPEFLALYEQCRQYTMTSWERLYALYKAVQYTVENRIPGDLVECGVWRGGSMKLVAHVLHSLGDTNRTLFLYDTFEGMTEPDPAVDVDFSGNEAVNDWREVQRRGVKWAYAPVEEVHEILVTSGYPMEKVKLVKGPVQETIPATIPASIALLRLDTDWYSSTKHEMEHLYPKLSPQGVLILDDHGHYRGARRGVDEYLSKLDKKPLLQRIDYSCRLAIKPTT